MVKKKRKRRSIFILSAVSYAVIAAAGCWLMRDRMDEAISSLVLFGLLPVVLVAWIVQAVHDGEVWRQGARSVTASLTMNECRISRRAQPFQFWLMVGLTGVFALAILAFVLIGIYCRLTMQE